MYGQSARAGAGGALPLLQSLAAGLVLVAALTSTAASASGTATAPTAVEPTQELAVLLRNQPVFSRPDATAVRIEILSARRPITLRPTVLPVTSHRTNSRGIAWLRVRLPGRPNGRTGWIRESATGTTSTPWHIVVARSSRQVTVYRSGRPVRRFKAIVGTSSTPTPKGRFFVEESVRLSAREAGAPFALALSARSNVLQEFAGGPGQIALHGLANVGGVLGTAASHGCVRLDNAAISWLVARVGPGAPVTIT